MKLGTNDIGSVYLGTNAVQKVYLGTNEVWTSFTGLLDTYSGAAAAYSLRLLSSTHTGSAIRVRRASDNTEQDIGFVDGELDTSTLTSFCSGTNGFVKTWYDQSGNGYDASQTTASEQPQIVSSGSVILENSKPSLKFDGSDDKMQINQTFNTAFSGFAIAASSGGGQTEILRGGSSGAFLAGSVYFSGFRFRTNTTNLDYLTYDTNQHLHTWINDTTTSYAAADGASFISNADSAINQTSLYISSSPSARLIWDGTMQEIILYPSDQSSNRTGIETNINDFYSIY